MGSLRDHDRLGETHRHKGSNLGDDRSANLRGVLIFGLWVLISLVAISFVGNHPYWALAIAIGGGVYLGWEEL